jgi:hypothetical protein
LQPFRTSFEAVRPFHRAAARFWQSTLAHFGQSHSCCHRPRGPCSGKTVAVRSAGTLAPGAQTSFLVLPVAAQSPLTTLTLDFHSGTRQRFASILRAARYPLVMLLQRGFSPLSSCIADFAGELSFLSGARALPSPRGLASAALSASLILQPPHATGKWPFQSRPSPVTPHWEIPR